MENVLWQSDLAWVRRHRPLMFCRTVLDDHLSELTEHVKVLLLSHFAYAGALLSHLILLDGGKRGVSDCLDFAGNEIEERNVFTVGYTIKVKADETAR